MIIVREKYKNDDRIRAEMRKPILATDTSKVIDTVLYYANDNYYKDYSEVWLCLPTCPPRTREDVAEGHYDLIYTQGDKIIRRDRFDPSNHLESSQMFKYHPSGEIDSINIYNIGSQRIRKITVEDNEGSFEDFDLSGKSLEKGKLISLENRLLLSPN